MNQIMQLNIKNLVTTQVILLVLMVLNSNIHLPCFLQFKLEFNVSESLIQFAFVINPFIAALTSVAYGLVADRWGRKKILLISIMHFAVGTFICASSHSIQIFFLGRFFQAVGDAGIAVVAGIVIGDCYKGKQYARLQAASNAAMSLSWALAPVIGAQMYTYIGWRWNFAIVAILLTFTSLPLFLWREDKSFSQDYPILQAKEEFRKVLAICMNRKFLSLCFAHALPLGIFAALELTCPFIFMRHFHYKPSDYATINFMIIVANIIGSFIYIQVIRHLSIAKSIHIGTTFYIIFTFICFAIVTKLIQTSSLIITVMVAIEAFSLPFFISSCTTKIIELYPSHLGIAFSLAALTRNLASSSIAFCCSLAINHSLYHVFLLLIVPTLLAFFFIRYASSVLNKPLLAKDL